MAKKPRKSMGRRVSFAPEQELHTVHIYDQVCPPVVDLDMNDVYLFVIPSHAPAPQRRNIGCWFLLLFRHKNERKTSPSHLSPLFFCVFTSGWNPAIGESSVPFAISFIRHRNDDGSSAAPASLKYRCRCLPGHALRRPGSCERAQPDPS